ncbi:unnamed protein product [Absidia cylindrospora]
MCSKFTLRTFATKNFRRHRPQSLLSTTSSSSHSIYSRSSTNSNNTYLTNSEHTGINYNNYNNTMYWNQVASSSFPDRAPDTMIDGQRGQDSSSTPMYYTTTADYDGRRHRSRSGSTNDFSPTLPPTSTIRSLSPPSLYDVRNSYEDSPQQSQAFMEADKMIPLPTSDITDGSDPTTVFPPTSEMQHMANLALEANNSSFKVVYAGLVSYKTVSALIPVNKRLYFVLTNHHLLQYKSEQKARSEIDLFDTNKHRNGMTSTTSSATMNIGQGKIVVHLRDVFGIHTVISPPNTFRIEYLESGTKQPQTLSLTTNTSKECQQWIDGFRHAVKVHHISMMAQGTVTSTERFAAVERLSKQKDMVDKRRNPLLIHKAIYKEKRIKITDGKNSTTKEVFQVVTLAIGKFSLYLLPPSGVADEKYLKSVERDRYGLLAIHSIQYSADDDTFKLLIGQVGHATRQLVLVSTYCEYIIQHLRQAIHAIALESHGATYSSLLPAHLQRAFITPLHTSVDDDMDDKNAHGGDSSFLHGNSVDQVTTQFNLVLHAYCAALNLNKARFQYELGGIPGGERSFTLLPPHEVNESSATYTKYELLAICRSLGLNPFFSQLIFREQSLKALEDWNLDKNDSWTVPLSKTLNVSDVLSHELNSILSANIRLHRLDITGCEIGSNKCSTASAMTVIGLNLRNGNCGLRAIMMGKNNMKATDLHTLLTGMRSCPKALVELDVHECGLSDEQLALLLTTILSERPEKLRLLDISATSKDPHPHHSHYRHQRQGNESPSTSTNLHNKNDKAARLDITAVQSILQRCKRLSILRLRGHNQTLEHNMFDISRLKELDLGYNYLGTSGVNILCDWMQTTSFNSVEALHVNGCGLDGRHLRELLVSITKSGNRRVHLNVGSNPVWREVMYIPKLCNALMQGEGPCSMSLAKTDWEDGTLREFLDCVRDNHTIMFLDLSDIRVTGCEALSDDTVRVLASVFERNTAIRELKLNITSSRSKEGCAHIGKGIVDAMDAGLKHNRALERLELNGVGIGDIGAAILANIISVNRVLQSIHIDENKITIDGYRALTTALEAGSSIIDLPKPRLDIRHQLTTLKETINELTQIENETKWFIMHSTGTDVKHAKTQLLMQQQARQAAELNYKQILDVVDDMLRSVTQNGQRFNTSHDKAREIQLQAQSAAQELAIAQLRLQSNRATSANLSAVGIQRMRTTNSVSSSYSSGSGNSHSDRATVIPVGSISTARVSPSPSQSYYHRNSSSSSSRSPITESMSQRPLSPLSGNNYYNNESSMASPTSYYSPYDYAPNQPLPPTPQLYDGTMSINGNLTVGGGYSEGSAGSLSRRNTATTSASIATSPRTPYGTPGPYMATSHSSSTIAQGGNNSKNYRLQRPMYGDDDQNDTGGGDYILDHPGFIEDFGGSMGQSTSGMNQRYQQQQQRHLQLHHQQQPGQHQQKKIYRLPEIPDLYSSHDSLHDEDRLCDQFKQRMFLPPDERD